MNEFQFELLADNTLEKLEQSLSTIDPDICDVSLSMGVLTLEFFDKTKYIINSHRAAKQIWMAANLTAWHFSYDTNTDKWLDDKTNSELLSTISREVNIKTNIGFAF